MYYLNYGNLSSSLKCHCVECTNIVVLFYEGSPDIREPEVKSYISAVSKTHHCQLPLLTSAASFSPHFFILCKRLQFTFTLN